MSVLPLVFFIRGVEYGRRRANRLIESLDNAWLIAPKHDQKCHFILTDCTRTDEKSG